MAETSPAEPDAAVLKALVELQESTACRKCKAKAWTLTPTRRSAKGGERAGIYVVLGRADESVLVVTFQCQSCNVTWERPCYTREQLARQEFPAVKLDVRADEPPAHGAGSNGKHP